MPTLMAPQDALFLLAERREQPMHVGGLQLFELPDGAGPEWVQALYERMLAATEVRTLMRRRPVRSLRTLGAWSWEADPEVDLEHHVRHSALARPGRVRELLALVSRLHGAPLDRQRPLWELHLIEGLQGDRFAVYTKVHHSLLDGVSAMRLLQESLSTGPDEVTPPPWAPASGPRRPPAASTPAPWVGRALRAGMDLSGAGPALARLVAERARSPEPWSSPPRTILNVPITGARRFAAQSWPLDRVRAVARAGGASVNDVVLAMCGAALRGYLRQLGELPEQSLVAMVPVALPRQDDGAAGNAVGAILTTLATDESDAAIRLERIHESMQQGKTSLSGLGPLGAGALSALLVGPLAVTTTRWYSGFGRQPFNLVVSNVPGPDHPLYMDGARLTGLYPLSVPLDGQALNVTATSYAGSLDFGLTGDRRALPHLQRLLTHLDRGLDDLAAAVGA